MFASLEAKLITAAIGAFFIAALVGAILFYRGDAIKAKADAATYQTQRDAALQINKDNAISLQRIAANEDNNAKLVAGLDADVKAIDAKSDQTQSAIERLSASDATVKTFLNQPLPSSLSALLNDGVRNSASANKAGN